jgi:hypothetical protein
MEEIEEESFLKSRINKQLKFDEHDPNYNKNPRISEELFTLLGDPNNVWQ